MKKIGKSTNFTSNLKPNPCRNSTGDTLSPTSRSLQAPYAHNSSISAIIPLDKSLSNKLSIEIEEIRQEIKDRENRHKLREKEIDEIYQNVSYEEELPHYSYHVVETSETIPTPRKEENYQGGNLILKCCRKYCRLF